MNLVAGSGVTGNIGTTNDLTVVNATGAGVVQLNGTINTATLNVRSGITLNAADNSAAAIAAINIGTAGVGGGTLVIDAGGANYNLPGGNIDFKHADSLLKLTNTANAGNSTVTLHGDLAPGGGVDLQGNLEINSAGTKTLDVDDNGGETIGTNNTHRLNELIVSGDQDTTIAPNIFAKTIIISSTANVNLNIIDNGVGDATSIKFKADGGDLRLSGNVTTKTLDINNKTRTVTVDDGVDLNFDDILNGANSTLTFDGDSNLNLFAGKTVTGGTIEAAANGKVVNLDAGTYTVTDIQLTNAGGTLKLADGFNLTGGINVAAGNAATVKFVGNGKVTGALGGANAVGAVTVAGNSTLQLGGDVDATSLNGNALNAQNLKFINAGNITVAGTVGNAQAFDQIEFNGGGRVTFGAGDLTTGQKLNFTENTEVVTDNYDLGATEVINANGVNGSKLTVNVDQTITGNVSKFGAVHVAGAAIRTVSINTANYLASVTGNKANVSFNHAGGNSSVNFLGSGADSINNANFVQNGKVYGEVHAKTIDVRAGRTATFESTVFEGNSMKMHANNARADFTAGVVSNMPILANAPGDGIISFNGGVDLRQDIGTNAAKVATVSIGGNSTINANIHSDAIDVGGHDVTLAGDKTFDGTTAFNGTKIKLGEHDLTMTGGKVTFTGASKINTTVTAKADLGNLIADAGSTIILQGANTLAVEVDDKAVLPVDGKDLKLIAKNGGGALNIDLSQVTVTATGAFSKWKKSIVADELVLTQESQIQEVITESASSAGLSGVISAEVAEVIENFEPETAGADFVLQLNQMTKPNIAEAVARTNTTSNEVSAVNFEILNDVTGAISGRIADVTSFVPVSSSVISSPAVSSPISTSPAIAPTTGGGATSPGRAGTSGASPVKTNIDKNVKVSSENNYISGFAAGDDHARFGVWVTPFYSQSTQKKRSSSSGFRSNSYGGTFGIDTKANENMVIGLAFSAMNTDIKHKDFKSGDKTKVSSFLVSAYATHQFTNNWFGQGVFSIGSSSVNNKENRRISNTQFAMAKGKYTSMTFATEILGGYNHLVNNKFVVTPMFGLNYNRINDSSYNESGPAGTPLMEVNKKASQKLDVVGGVRLTAMPFMTNGVEITPEVHAFVRHDVIGKGAKVNAKIPGLNLPSEKAKLQKTFYSVGASLNAAYGAMDYGVSADASFANKYVGVQGSVKVRVNF